MKTSVLNIVAALALGALQAYGHNGFHAITTAHGNGADAYIDGTSANYGGATILAAKPSSNRKAYIRFDISGIQKPLKYAAFELTVETMATRTPSFYGLNDASTAGSGHLGENWSESLINWTSAPAHTNAYVPAVGAGTTDGGQCQILGLVEYTIGLSDSNGVSRVVLANTELLDFLNADSDGLVTIIIAYPSTSGSTQINWMSKEHAANTPPRLLLGDAMSSVAQLSTAADSYVYSTSPSSNYGTADSVIVRANSGIYKGYLRFNLSGIKRPILAASLVVNQSDTTQWDTLSVYGLNNGATAGNGKLGEVWSDSEITADNAPANIAAANGFYTGSATADGGQAQLIWSSRSDLNGVPGKPFLLTAEQSLVDFLNADTNDTVTIMMHAAATSGARVVRFATKENTTYAAPTLALVYTPPPRETLITIK